MLETSLTEALNNLQEITLRRERLLQRLRRELTRFSRCLCNEDFIRDLIRDLRDSRQKYVNTISDNIEYLRNFNDDRINTLLEYSALVGFNNELELLIMIYRYVRNGKIRSIEVSEILKDIEDVKYVINVLNKQPHG